MFAKSKTDKQYIEHKKKLLQMVKLNLKRNLVGNWAHRKKGNEKTENFRK